MLQDPLFTWVFCVIPLLIGFINKYFIMKGKDEEEYPKWSAFIAYYLAGSILFWGIVSFARMAKEGAF